MPTQQPLLIMRIVWATFFVSQTIFACAMGIIAVAVTKQGSPMLYPTMTYTAAIILVAAVLFGYFLRNQIYKAGWQGQAIGVAHYFKGNLALWTSLEATGIFALVTMILTEAILLHLLLAGIAIVVHATGFPTGKPLQPAEPRIGAGT